MARVFFDPSSAISHGRRIHPVRADSLLDYALLITLVAFMVIVVAARLHLG